MEFWEICRSRAAVGVFAERFSAPQLSIDPNRVDTLTVKLLDASVPY